MGMIEGTPLNQRIMYLIILITIHHLILYTVIYLSLDSIWIILKNTFFTSFLPFIMVYISPDYSKKQMSRKFLLPSITVFTAVLFIGRLISLQLINSSYKLLSDDNAVIENEIFPERDISMTEIKNYWSLISQLMT